MAHNVERAEAREITAEIKAAVEAILEARGMKLTVGMTHFGETYDVKLSASKVAVDPATGVDLGTKAAGEWKLWHSSYGLPADALGKEVVLNGKTFKIVGLNTKKYTKPVVLQMGGREYATTAEAVKVRLAVAR